jgi:hypothetical protein
MAVFDVGNRVDFELGFCQIAATIISQEEYLESEKELPPNPDDYVYLRMHDYQCNGTLRDNLRNRTLRVSRTILPRLIKQGQGP